MIFSINTMSKKKTIRKPSKFVYFMARLLVYPFFKLRYRVKSDRTKIKGIKPPFILLCNHEAAIDPCLIFGELKGYYMNPVGGYAYFKNKYYSWLLRLIGGIPKFQYSSDIQTMKNMITVTKQGGILALFPTGRNSTCGEGFPIPDNLAKLIKISKCKVVLSTIHGTYLSSPKWRKSRRKGRVSIDFEPLFDEKQVVEMDITEMTKILNKKLNFNEYEWNREKQYKYKGKDLAENIDNILYRCPKCGAEFEMISKGNVLKCNHCGNEFVMEETGFFKKNDYFEHPAQYYNWQRESINELIKQDFTIEDHVKCKMSLEKGIEYVGEGRLIIKQDLVIYKGTIKGEEKEIEFDTKDLFSLPFRSGVNIELSMENDIYQFEFDNRYLPSKLCLIIEETYKVRNNK